MDVIKAQGNDESTNDVISAFDISAIEDSLWQSVSSRYALALRITIGVYAAIFLLTPWLAYILVPDLPLSIVLSENLLAVMLFSFLAFVWVPRRVRHTKYLLRELDASLQTGCWWHVSTSVAINRIQHLEVTQGPIERALNLSKLHVFTAGGARSDMEIPGLEIDKARRLKAHLLAQVGSEEEPDDELL